MNKLLIGSAIGVFALISIVAIFVIPLPYYAVFPGDIINLGDAVQVENSNERESFYAISNLIFENTYSPPVGLSQNAFEVNLLVYLIAQVDNTVTLEPIPQELENITTEEIKNFQFELMNQSNQIAAFVSSTYLGVQQEDINISFGELAGSSGSMVAALEVIQQLGDEDLIRGRKIAGTGELVFDGTVLEIGGVKQKLYTSRKNNIDVLIIPAQNNESTVGYEDIQIIRVHNITDAIEQLLE